MGRLFQKIREETGLSGYDLAALINRAPVSYKYYKIPKRSGGYRLIAQPAAEIKALQRIAQRAFGALPVHPAARAYIKGLGIKSNAEAHVQNGPILKYDFEEFFPSLRASDWISYCRSKNVLEDEDDIENTAKLFFCRRPSSSILRLSIGAPTSPWLSNILLFEFDRLIADAVARDKVTFTRYADDLTFSAARTGHLVNVDRNLRQVIGSLKSPRLTINEGKTTLALPKFKRFVTGLVLANDGRVTIGRQKKREIRAALHHAQLGVLGPAERAQLAGLLAYVQGVEPEYIEKLNVSYGGDLGKLLRDDAELRRTHR